MKKVLRITLPRNADDVPAASPVAPSLAFDNYGSDEYSESATTATDVISAIDDAGAVVITLAADGTQVLHTSPYFFFVSLYGAVPTSEVVWTLTWTPDDPADLGSSGPYVNSASRTAIVVAISGVTSSDQVAHTYVPKVHAPGSGTISATVNGRSAGSIAYSIVLP